MNGTIHTSISKDVLSLDKAYQFVNNDAHGAITLFSGVVRNHHEGKEVQGITYDAHDVLAKNVLTEICEEAQKKWQGITIYVSHFKGELPIGGISIIIAVSAAHRAESYEANRYVIEEVKKRLPVWKQEHYPEGKSEWLPGTSLSTDIKQVVG